ncbi:MAG TPA: NAD-dependent epimerase/dehydratase family protein [Solirubrobacteraceae bacterium]|nr:NAD-dependent epimerase/dehydratase family protein [Solirubrobacteraceae bacterium]
MRVLVTGGSGFIGSHVVDSLASAGHEPVVFDLCPSPWHADVETHLGSITDVGALTQALSGCDAVAHLAAVADVNDVLADPARAEEINSRGTVTVLEAMRRTGVARIVYASTIWVYSDTPRNAVDEDTPLPPPAHLYTATKLAGELYCRSYAELYGISPTILRFGIPYGPRAREAAVIPAFVNKALAGEPLTLSGDGLQSRRFVYVRDLADGVVAGLDDAARGRVYNLVSDEDVTIRQIAELVQEFVGDTEIVLGPARPGDLGSKLVSGARAASELGWSARTPFREGVRRYIAWKQAQAPSPARAAADLQRVDATADAAQRHPALALAAPAETDAGPGAATLPEAPKVLVLTADIGAGHDLPAAAVAREFLAESPGAQITVVNSLVLMGRFLTHALRENSAFMFRWMPWLFDLQYRLFMHVGPTRWLSRRLLTALGSRGLMRLVRAHNPDVVVSTYPGATAILAEMRQRGRLKVPLYSSITDLAGLHHWAHPGVDMHFITHPESAAEVEAIAGPGSVRWSRPPTDPIFFVPRDRDAARQALGLGIDGERPLIAVSGGGWGLGDLCGAVRAALGVEEAIVLCLCGHNAKARTRVELEFAGEPRLHTLGFTDQMGDILAAADVLVHSSAGLTVLEAIIRGCPVISYGFGYGHIRASNLAYERFGLAQVARTEAELGPALSRALSAGRPAPDARFAERASTATLIRNCQRRTRALPVWRVRTVRALTTGATALVLGAWAMTASVAYSVISEVAPVQALTAVTTARPQVGLMLEASPQQVPALITALHARGLRASFALRGAGPQRGTETAMDRATAVGDSTLPLLNDSGLINWLATPHELRQMTEGLGIRWHHPFLYASSGPSLGQWLFAHGTGGRLVAGRLQVGPGWRGWDRGTLANLHAGAVIAVRFSSLRQAVDELAKVADELHRHHLRAVPVSQLLHDSGTPV